MTASAIEVVVVVPDDEVELEQKEPSPHVELDVVVVDMVVLEVVDAVVVDLLDSAEELEVVDEVIVMLVVEGGGLVMEAVLEIVVLDVVVLGVVALGVEYVEDDRVDSVVASLLTLCSPNLVYARTTVRDAKATTTTIATASILRDGPPVAIAVKRASLVIISGRIAINSYVRTVALSECTI